MVPLQMPLPPDGQTAAEFANKLGKSRFFTKVSERAVEQATCPSHARPRSSFVELPGVEELPGDTIVICQATLTSVEPAGGGNSDEGTEVLFMAQMRLFPKGSIAIGHLQRKNAILTGTLKRYLSERAASVT
jgi:hypothetical protein